MIYEFDNFDLDVGAVELREDGNSLAIEPQVFSLLVLLVENSDRMVSKDEIIEKIWEGRIVSESAVTSRIKSVRQVLGDDGKTQKYLKTIHGKGFRFTARVRVVRARQSTQFTPIEQHKEERDHNETDKSKPSIAVLPFRLIGIAGPYSAIADALPHELISELSRLRWLFVIARGSSFRFSSHDPDVAEIRGALGVRYFLSGLIEVYGNNIIVSAELVDTRDGGVVWADRFDAPIDDIYNIRKQIVSNIVSSLEIQIPVHEAQRARDVSIENLDAWAAYHIGLQYLHRFNNVDNKKATMMFERAIQMDPGFARAHAGISSTYFQNAFLGYNQDRESDRIIARRHAERGVELDPLDPFANFVMGRVHWVEDDVAGGVGWLDRAISLSPNYAKGVYAKSWAEVVSGRNVDGAKHVDLAMMLSPLDPFRYAMLGVRAFTHLAQGNKIDAAHYADEAARTPGAHVLIAMIAVACHELNGDRKKAALWAENVRSRNPALSQSDFFKSFPFEDMQTQKRLSVALDKHGF